MQEKKELVKTVQQQSQIINKKLDTEWRVKKDPTPSPETQQLQEELNKLRGESRNLKLRLKQEVEQR